VTALPHRFTFFSAVFCDVTDLPFFLLGSAILWRHWSRRAPDSISSPPAPSEWAHLLGGKHLPATLLLLCCTVRNFFGKVFYSATQKEILKNVAQPEGHHQEVSQRKRFTFLCIKNLYKANKKFNSVAFISSTQPNISENLRACINNVLRNLIFPCLFLMAIKQLRKNTFIC
jgi:hypothetical protein